MKKLIKVLLLSFFVFSFASCGSTPASNDEAKEAPKVAVDEAEYERATSSMNGKSVSMEQFEKDKSEILKIIDDLQVIMETKDFDGWLQYVAPESKKIYSKPRKIFTPAGIRINDGLEDFFLNVFIESRRNTKVSEIKYNSNTSVKAINYVNGKSLVYYNFVKDNGQWYVVLPTDILVK